MTKPTIELSESVFKKIQVLSPENQKQILDFLESITANSDETQEKKATRISGLYQGQGWISDDFNDPLTDEFFSEV
ncbi:MULTISPECIES: DUF2281 domain-containing protein [unclassified Synechocystis]|jgi:mRNA-degrading endonuclease RelE of RelBE toxin-antitoxin system|uniref:DUF2281 domain-containing protein n=1 Tax=unclassified Synechocystis TaxID=2640012 RepID=UPI0002A5B36F|nr:MULTISPECIES: DUF2281 domain-containing protein [unclassified Synechocystis]BAM54807.1 hypothetical protein BEST7613_5876 [Synechocystis sp. PCC 6803] [Bacillus subtilis BEST7613]ALJ68113.1 hypothetical protein AOY38_09850 [Synechocystis sp. PCC 6803]AVP89950.1 DUF2281 domain-containing protein [Synechocystis sp. IPPAS B-1465]MBD2617800.1 DUF2281 domain-containing protein [Synechocystis sp. FACHB-898]MBD2640487.1 DUF2281 domain-containing protein [Synechocystis sp. FACHB-908]